MPFLKASGKLSQYRIQLASKFEVAFFGLPVGCQRGSISKEGELNK